MEKGNRNRGKQSRNGFEEKILRLIKKLKRKRIVLLFVSRKS